MFKFLSPLIAATCLACVTVPAMASVGIGTPDSYDQELDFTGAICAQGACSNGSFLSQSYGDIAGALDVSHQGLNLDKSTYEPALKYWTSGYSGIGHAIWTGGNDMSFIAEMRFAPAAGYKVALQSLVFGSYANSSPGSSFVVLDALTLGTLYSSGRFNPAAGTAAEFTLPSSVASSNGLILRWGADAYNMGLGAVSMSVTPVPEAETWAMLLAGLGVMGTVVRRRGRQA